MLYVVALSYYHYLNFLGYSALPFLHHTEVSPRVCDVVHAAHPLKTSILPLRVHPSYKLSLPSKQRSVKSWSLLLQVFLWPIGGIVMAAVFAVLTNFNPTRFTLGFYFL